MRVLAAVALILSSLTSVWSQDSLVHVNELQFFSPFEKKSIENFLNGSEPDYYSLFMASGNLLTEAAIIQNRDRLTNYIKGLQHEKFNSKKNDKKARFIYEDVHQKFLQKYELINKFEDIFFNGSYNCVSASALYGILFEKAGIPYIIKEKPTHVYLVAYPETDQIMIETTSPVGGVFAISAAFKQNYIKVLKDQKIIGNKEAVSHGTDALFDKYYFSDQEDISLLNLVGIQYMNDAIQKMEEKNYEGAIAQLEKAYLFYPVERCAYMLVYNTVHHLGELKAKDVKHAATVARLARFTTYGITPEMLQAEFGRAVNELLFVNPNIPNLEAYYKSLSESLTDSVIKKEISFHYQFERGRFMYNRSNYAEAIPFFEAALELKPTYEEINSAFLSTLSKSFEIQGDNLTALKTLRAYSEKYPSLQTHNLFNSMLSTALLIQLGMEYTLGNAVEGDNYKAQHEAHRSQFPTVAVNSSLIGQSYSSAAVYYFRKGQVSKAKSIIAKGLQYAPGNYELLARQQMIK